MKPSPSTKTPLLYKVEDGLLVACMTILLFVSIGQIALRNTFSLILPWADPFIRHVVLWVGLLGALSATRHNKHVKIDALQHLMSSRIKYFVSAITQLFSTLICLLLTWHAGRFIADERAFSTMAFGDIAAWKLQLVFPFVFAGLSLRYGRYTINSIAAFIGAINRTDQS